MSKFLYFAYGSNLLPERIHLNNPSATIKGIAELKGYKLDFFNKSLKWQGGAASLTASSSDSVWGVVWELDLADLTHLDKQERVGTVYKRITVKVLLPDEETLDAYSYEMLETVKEGGPTLPSAVYHHVIISGAKQNMLPESYLDYLRCLDNNGETGGDDCPIVWDIVKHV